jgi:hypothetical protein
MEEDKDRDRLELVRSIRFALGALGQSLAGWMQWVNNPDIISMFSQDELVRMNKSIMDFAKSFIEYDIKMTNEGINKGVQERSTQRTTSGREFYV